jgi:hypothetical protein
MLLDTVAVKGKLQINVIDENGNLKDQRKVDNLVVAVGKNYIASRMASNSATIMSHMAVGTSNTAATTSQTLLGGENGRVSLDSTTVTANAVSYIATFPAGTGTGTLTEAGIFNSATTDGGTMLCRTNFNDVNKASGDTIIITWNVTVI